MSNFRVGQRVVCVRDGSEIVNARHGEILPTKGAIYTVRNVTNFGIGLRLVEIANSRHWYGWLRFVECSYSSVAFRPLIEKTNDAGMAILLKLLEPETERIEA